MYDGKLPDNEPITFQCAILHTTSAGQRRIRVHNLSLAVTSLVANVFRMADLDSLIQYSCKKAISQIKTVPIPTLVNHFHIRSAQALGSYRKFCASAMPAGQLVLPESLKLLPIFCLAFSKCSAFSASITQIDVRMAALFSMMSAGMKELPAHFYPRLFPLHRLLELPPDQTVPPRIRLSQEFLEPHGIYLLDNGSQLLLWVGSMVDPEALSKIFGVAQVAALPSYPDSLPELANPASQRARHLIEMVQSRYDKNLTLQIIRQSVDPSEVHWQNSMVEDAQGSLGPSYVDFLCRLHNQINHEMNSASLAERTALLSFLQ
jgi:protein transport protein SEC24